MTAQARRRRDCLLREYCRDRPSCRGCWTPAFAEEPPGMGTVEGRLIEVLGLLAITATPKEGHAP